MQSQKCQSFVPRKIQIHCINENVENADPVFMMVKDNAVRETSLITNFGEGRLTGKRGSDVFYLDSDKHYFFIEPDFHVYHYKMKDQVNEAKYKLGSKQRTRLFQLTDSTVRNKKQTYAEEQEEQAEVMKEVPFEKKVIHVGWLHKKSNEAVYASMGPKVAPTIKIVLNKYELYTYTSLKNIILEQYITEDNQSFFTNCSVNIGTRTGLPISNFVYEGSEYTFWDYSKLSKLRSHNHNLKLYLLTMKTGDTSTKNKTDHALVKDKLEDMLIRNKANDTLIKNNSDAFLYSEFPKGQQDPSCISLLQVERLKNNNEKVLTDVTNSSNSTGLNVLTKSISRQSTIVNTNIARSTCCKSQDQVKSPLLPEVNKTTNCNETQSIPKVNDEIVEKKKLEYNFGDYSDEETFTFLEPNDRVYTKIKSYPLSIQLIKQDQLKFTNVLLGKGAQGSAIKGRYLGTNVAIKSIQKGMDDKSVLKEILLLGKINHPNIILIMAVCSTYTQIHIVIEYFISDSLFRIIFDKDIQAKYPFTEKTKTTITCDIAQIPS